MTDTMLLFMLSAIAGVLGFGIGVFAGFCLYLVTVKSGPK